VLGRIRIPRPPRRAPAHPAGPGAGR
jgi:hypothetical protein